MGDVQGVPTSAYLGDGRRARGRRRGMLADRFAGTPQLQQALAARMRGMFGVVPRRSDEWLMFDKAGVFGLADDLTNDGPHWSPGQYSAALAALMVEK